MSLNQTDIYGTTVEDDRSKHTHHWYLCSLQAHYEGSLYMSQSEHYVSRLTLVPAVGKLSHQKELQKLL